MKRARSRAFTNLGQPLNAKRSVSVVTFGVCFALLLSSVSSLWSTTVTANDVIPFAKVRAQQNGSPNSQNRTVAPLPPRLGPPAANLPSLNELRTSDANIGQARSLKPPRPMPSTMRSRRKARWLTPERRLASDTTARFAWPAETQERAHHARAKSYAPGLVTSPQTPPPPDTRINYALASNGGAASVSSTLPPNSGGAGTYWSASALNNGDRKGTNWGYGGGWADASPGSFPDWVQIDFNTSKTIDEIDLFTIQDNFPNPSEPTQTTTFSAYGVTSYEVQYWNGSGWVGIAGGTISGNNKVWRQVMFAPVITSKIRVHIVAVIDNGYSRMTEIEAWGSGTPPVNVAAAANGATTTASSTLNANFPASGVINGDRKGLNWGSGGGWADASSGTLPDWVQIDFNGSKTISEIDLFTLQNNYTNPADPTESMTFSSWGVSGYNVQYWNSETSGWTTVSGGSITGNNKVWRKITFSPITTTKIKVNTTAAIDNGYSRLTEIEAWSISANDGGNLSDFAMARLDPQKRTGTGGEDLLSNNFNWNLPLVSLPGRSGLDLGLTLSYNSLVWTGAGNSIDFDVDDGSIAPGFRLGFPTVEGPYWNSQANANFYLLVTPSGGRMELRQIGNSISYEAVDSSHVQLTDNFVIDGTLLLRTTDGSQLRFNAVGGTWRCTKITDRNGNYISATYKSWGELEMVTDTLGRVLTFTYDTNANVESITQTWNGQTHQWATFGWGTAPIGNNFPSLTNLGPNSTTIPVLTQVGLPDGSRYNFEYSNSYGIISTIRHYASDNHQRNYTTYVTPASAIDCPRLTERRDWAEYWSGVNGVPAEVVTSFGHDADNGCRMTLPDGTVHKQYYGSSWQGGLSTETRSYATVADANSNVWQKKTTTAWTQDNPSVGYLTNPRVTETNVYDSSNNRRRVTVDYGSYVQWGLPHVVKEYAGDGATELRRSQTDYNLSQPYLDRRIIGLVSASQLYDAVEAQWQAKVTYSYDATAINSQATTAVMHDQNYNASFTVRGNVTAVSRWDVTDINNSAKALTSQVTYNAAGSVLSTADPATHTNSLSYAESFSDGNNSRNTFAYPTTVTDADGFSSTVQYNFDSGVVTRTQAPPPAGQPQGRIQTMLYDDALRLTRVTTENNSAYTRYVYGPYWVQSFSTINTIADEAYAVTVFDGFGRPFGAVNNHPGSLGGYRLLNTIFDLMGRAIQRSNSTEINGSWVPVGDDAAGVFFSQQTYDWQGRPRITTNQDGTYKEASYSGCGCAGGEVVTLTDEVGRQQKIYSDVLGRQRKAETLNQNGTVYSATTNDLNARDQIKLVRQWVGAENGGGAYQDTTITFDGHGRLQSKHVPEQNAGTATVYTYNADDTLQSVTDARGASATYGYNSRHLVTSINFSTPAGVTPTPNVTFGFDAAGNRTSMTDGSGSATYSFDSLSRLQSETKTLNGLSGSYSLNYGYNLAGELTSLTDPANSTINYSFDATGRLNSVTGSAFANVTQYAINAQYRAWGDLKGLSYGNGRALTVQHNSRLQTTRFDVPNVITKDYQYYDDGRLRYSQDFRNDRFDRSYAYDHAARISQALTGIEARGGQSVNGTDRPYNETFGYDPLNHVTARTTHYWNELSSLSQQYVNNRNTQLGWNYDADGRVLASPDVVYSYDAAASVVSFGDNSSVSTEQKLDGDGRRTKSEQFEHNEQTWTWESKKITYYLRSSVLGGAVVTELNADGTKRRAFVHAGGGILATQIKGAGSSIDSVEWEHRDPSNVSYRATIASGEVIGETAGGSDETYPQEFDPVGADAGLAPPLTWNPPLEEPVGSLMPYPRMMDPSNLGVGYSMDGIPMPADDFFQMARSLMQGRFGLLQAAAKASAPRFAGYSVYPRGGGSPWNFGSDLQSAASAAIAEEHFTVERNWLVSNWSDSSSLPEPQQSGLRRKGPAFSVKQDTILNESHKRISQEDCKNFINGTLAKYKVDKAFNSLDKLLSKATFGYYDVNAEYTSADLGVDYRSTILLMDDFANRGASAVAVGTSVFLSQKVFERSSSIIPFESWNRIADTPSYIVHELFHVAGIDKSIVDSQWFTNEIRKHCGLVGSEAITLRH